MTDRDATTAVFTEEVQQWLKDRGHNLAIDGWAGQLTQGAFEAEIGATPPPEILVDFRGMVGWIHAEEGHSGRPYWPGGASGITLDPGTDLGHVAAGGLRAYASLLTSAQYHEAGRVLTLRARGAAAQRLLERNVVLQGITISRQSAKEILPKLLRTYWDAALKRFGKISLGEAASGAVQTTMLSLAYNRGAGNPHLEKLVEPIGYGDWARVADIIGAMQQHHKLTHIRERRRREANLIRAQLGIEKGAP